jgi:iron complex transport system substrate-binding protein
MKGLVKNTCLLFLAVTLFAGLISGCSVSPQSTTSTATTTIAPTTTATTPVTTPAVTLTPTTTVQDTMIITDHYNRAVTITKNPQRIISLSPANTEILFALELGDRIVGVSDYSDYPEEAKSKTNVGAYDTPNIEQIVALEPDLVIATEEHQAEIEQLESRGITVIAVNPKTVAEVLATIKLLGRITGQDDKAAALVTSIQQRIDAITAKTKALTTEQRLRVFVVIWHDPIWTVGSGTFHDELIRMAGGVNVAGDLTGYTSIGLEAVIAANPQVIIAGVGMGEGESLSLQFMQTDERLKGTDARVNNRVYGANMDIVSRPGPRLADALETFFSLIHPELK